MMKLIAILLICCNVFVVTAQQTGKGKISLIIVNDKQAALENTTVELLKAQDSSLVKTAISDKNGSAEFDNISFGNYIVKASFINYDKSFSPAFSLSEENKTVELSKLILSATATQLKEVTVVTKKPFIQKLTDRIVVNVDNGIVNAGSTAFEVLEKSPGVNIDPNDVISLRGRQGVIIMIDGKITPMAGADLANYLHSLPSNAIDRIDLITNPSSKYDAAGNSGIIDIRMKKDQRLGTNGTVTAGYGQGVYPKANAGATLNYRNKKINLFANYNYAYRENMNHLYLLREFFTNGIYKGAYDQNNFIKVPSNSHATRFGADFFPDKKTIIGIVFSGNMADYQRYSNNSSIVLNENAAAQSTFTTSINEQADYQNYLTNINYKRTFDSTGREITADVDYGVYNNNSISTSNTGFYALNGTILKPNYKLNGDQQGEISIITIKADYIHPLKKEAKIETGFKTSFVETDNDVKFYDASTEPQLYDSSKSNHFIYNENNIAAYINFNKELKKWSFMAGLRAEQTNIKGNQIVTKEKFDSSYLQFFPSMFVNYKITEEKIWGISVSRRIDRPNYSELNPFRFFLDPSTYSSGNPYLRPQTTWNYELSYTLKQLNFTLGYSHTKDNETTVIRPSETEDKVTIQIPVNLTSYDYYGLTVAAPVKITKWWNTINNLTAYYGHYNGNLANTNLDNGTPAIEASNNNSFTIKKGWSAELNAYLNTGGQYGFMVVEPQWQLSAGIQKQVLQKKGTIRFNITDIFWTNLPKAKVTFTDYIENWRAERETRVATISFTYRFGKNTIAPSRKRTTASEEERQRAG